jgi:hypothetical protein
MKFTMKNADIPSKQIYNRDYWDKKRQNTNLKKDSSKTKINNQNADWKILLKELRTAKMLRKEGRKIINLLLLIY